MAKVLGVGGIFFKSKNPKELGAWYQKWLNFAVESHGAVFQPADLPPGAIGVWTPFPNTTEYFNPSTRDFMFNLVVDNLDGALKQVVEGGATLAGDVEDNEFGRFGWFVDPEGNKVELWQPPPEPVEG